MVLDEPSKSTPVFAPPLHRATTDTAANNATAPYHLRGGIRFSPLRRCSSLVDLKNMTTAHHH